MEQILTSKKVEDIFYDCLFTEEEVVDGKPIVEPVLAEGVMCKVGFHPERLKNHTQEIFQLLDELPDKFRQKTGGGWSFLNACVDKHGNQWTGLHQIVEQLFMLGIASDKVHLLAPRDLWKTLPGGMPYYVIKD